MCIFSRVVLLYLLTFCFCHCNFIIFVILLVSMVASIVRSFSMPYDDSDGGESSMHMVCPPTPEPLEPNMLCFGHREWEKEKRKIMFIGIYVLFWYTPKEWQEKVVEIDTKVKETTKTCMGKR